MAFSNGEVMVIKIFQSKAVNFYFMASEKEILFIKFLFGGSWLCYGDDGGQCVLIYLHGFQAKSLKPYEKPERPDKSRNLVFRIFWDAPIEEGFEGDANDWGDKGVEGKKTQPVKATHILEDPTLYNGVRVFYLVDDEGRFHCVEVPENHEDLLLYNEESSSNRLRVSLDIPPELSSSRKKSSFMGAPPSIGTSESIDMRVRVNSDVRVQKSAWRADFDRMGQFQRKKEGFDIDRVNIAGGLSETETCMSYLRTHTVSQITRKNSIFQ